MSRGLHSIQLKQVQKLGISEERFIELERLQRDRSTLILWGKIKGGLQLTSAEKAFQTPSEIRSWMNHAAHQAQLQGITHLDLSSLELRFIPKEIEKLTGLRDLDLSENLISDLSSLTALIHLTDLNLNQNQISDISPLAALIRMEGLLISENQIHDVSSLQGLIRLEHVTLAKNYIQDIAPLRTLIHLNYLNIWLNQVRDVSCLQGLNIKTLNVTGNPIQDYTPLDTLPLNKIYK